MDNTTENINRVERRKGNRRLSSGNRNSRGGLGREQKRKLNRTLKFILWLIQLVAEGALGYLIYKLGMLSTPLMTGAFAILALLLVATFFLFGLHRKGHRCTIIL